MDEMNKNINPGETEASQGENQEDIKIWHKPETGRKKIYVYEVKTEESEEEVLDEEKAGGEEGTESVEEKEENQGEAEKVESKTTGYEFLSEETEMPSSDQIESGKKGFGFGKGIFAKKKSVENNSERERSAKEKSAKGKFTREKSAREKSVKGASKGKADNLLEKDNVSKAARQEFWKKQMVEGVPNQKSLFRRAGEFFGNYYKKIISVALILILLFGGSYYYSRIRRYHGYDVEWQMSATSSGYSNYLSFNDVVLHYSQDGVSCINQDGEVMWNQSFNMDVPGIAVREDYAVIYDIKGTSLYICNAEGCTGSAETTKKILKADISAAGVVAVVLDDKTSNYVNYFRKDGSQLGVEIKTLISGDGYPLDIAISPDGTQLMSSYMYANSGSMMNQVVFRNFEVGKNEVDRVVGGFRDYKETLVPEVIYFDNQNSAAITEKSIDFYSTRNALEPKLAKTRELDSRIKTVFYNQEYVGVVLDSDSGSSGNTSGEETKTVESAADEGTVAADAKQAVETSYTMLVFDQSGDRVFEQEINFEYDYADFSGDGIVVYNSGELAVYNLNGVCKYQDRLNMNIEGVARFSEKSLVIHGNEALQKITLK